MIGEVLYNGCYSCVSITQIKLLLALDAWPTIYTLQCGKLRGVTDYGVCSVYALVAAVGPRFV